jgi:NitT/TauT family transport system substrate-binding protein
LTQRISSPAPPISRTAFLRDAATLAIVVAAGAPALAQTPEATRVNIGTPGQQGNAGVYYAQDMGFFKRIGLDANIITLRQGSGAGVVAAVTGGTLDIGEADLISFSAAHARGIKISLLAPSAVWISTAVTAALVVPKASPVHAARDLNGKTIGVASLAGLNRVTAAAWLEQNGADLASVKFVELPSSSMPQAVTRGTVDAAVITEPTLSVALADSRMVAAPYDAIGKQFIETAWFASDDWIAKNPQLAVRFAVAMRDAQRWANDNPTLAQGIYAKYSGATLESLKNVVHQRYGDVLDPARMQPLVDVAFKYHVIPQPIAAKDLISPAITTLPR